jgi:hypothetical protein
MSKPQYQNKDWQNAFKNVNHPDPSAAQDVATKNYVDTVARGLRYKTVRAKSTADVDISQLNNGDTLDGVTLATNDQVLLGDQATASQDGIYTVGATAGTTVRSTGVNGLEAGDDARGLAVSIAEGTANGNKTYVQTAEPAIVGTDGLTFGVLGGSSGLTIAGAGLLESPAGTVNLVAGDTSLTANTDDTVVNLATNGGLEVSSGVKVKLNGATLTLGASGLSVTTPVDTSIHARWGTALGPGSAGATITQAHGFGHKSLIVQVKRESDMLDITDGVEVTTDATNIVVTFGASQADRSAFRLVWVG